MAAVHSDVIRLTDPANKAFLVNPYWVLGCAFDASSDELRAHYRELSMRLHPDKNRGSELAQDAFAALNEAFQQLTDAELRRTYEVFADEARLRARQKKPAGEPATADDVGRELMQIFLEQEEQRVRTEERKREERLRQRQDELLAEQEKKELAERNTEWDKTREKRVSAWKDFQKKGKSKRPRTK